MKKTSQITFINIIAVAGFALLAVASFMGALFLTKGSWSISAAIAAIAVLLPALALAGAIKCKEVESDFSRWKKVEITLAIIFWLTTLPGAYCSLQFFNVMGHRDRLAETALGDVNSLKEMFSQYEQFENNALSLTRISLENALGQPSDEMIDQYMATASINSVDNIDSWIETQRRLLLGNRGVDGFSYISYKEAADSVAGDWLSHISSGDILFMASHASDINVVADDVAQKLTANSTQAKLPVFEFADGSYRLSDPGKTIAISTPDLLFNEKIVKFGGVTATGIIFLVVVLMMIYLDYLMAHRSDKISLGQYSNGSVSSTQPRIIIGEASDQSNIKENDNNNSSGHSGPGTTLGGNRL